MKRLIGSVTLALSLSLVSVVQAEEVFEVYEGTNTGNPFTSCFVQVYRSESGEILKAAEGRFRFPPKLVREGNEYRGVENLGNSTYTFILEVEDRDGRAEPVSGTYLVQGYRDGQAVGPEIQLTCAALRRVEDIDSY